MQAVLCFIHRGGNSVFLNSSLNFLLLRGPLDLPRRDSEVTPARTVLRWHIVLLCARTFHHTRPLIISSRVYRDARCQLPFIYIASTLPGSLQQQGSSSSPTGLGVDLPPTLLYAFHGLWCSEWKPYHHH